MQNSDFLPDYIKLAIMNQIVVGIANKNLSEKFQLDKTLTLKKAVTYVRKSEVIKKQQLALRRNANLDDVGAANKKNQSTQK